MFYGFATVAEHALDTTNGGAVYRTTVSDFSTDSYYDRGLATRTRVFDAAGNLFTGTPQTYGFPDVSTGADPADVTSTTATIFPMLVRTNQPFHPTAPPPPQPPHPPPRTTPPPTPAPP